jgi:hypothetical protein
MDVFAIVNNGAPVTLSDITIKFWADDTSGVPLTCGINYGGCLFNPSCFHTVSNITASAVSFAPACGPDPNHQANWEFTVSNTDPALFTGGVSWVGIQTTVHRGDYGFFSPGSSYWYSPCVGTGYGSDVHFALYLQGKLVTTFGGVPPSCRPVATCTPIGGKAEHALEENGTPTITPSPISTTALSGLMVSAVAAPNIVMGGQLVQFLVNLNHPAQVNLTLYTLTGERVYSAQTQGSSGMNSLTWELKNNSGAPVASGLYLYVIQAADGTRTARRTGKMVVIH